MKSLKIAVGIFIGLLLINVYMFFYLKNTVESVIEKTETAKTSIMNKDKEKTLTILNDLQEDIDKYHQVWHVMSNHGEVDKVQAAIAQCIGYTEYESYQDVLSNLYSLQYYVNNLLDREKINLSNIF